MMFFFAVSRSYILSSSALHSTAISESESIVWQSFQLTSSFKVYKHCRFTLSGSDKAYNGLWDAIWETAYHHIAGGRGGMANLPELIFPRNCAVGMKICVYNN